MKEVESEEIIEIEIESNIVVTSEDNDEALDNLLDSKCMFDLIKSINLYLFICIFLGAMNQFENLKVKSEEKQQDQQSKVSSSAPKIDEVRDFLDDFVDKDPKLKEEWTKLTESCQKAGKHIYYFPQ